MTENLSISDLFPSRYLRSSDVGDSDMTLTIEKVVVEELGTGDRKDTKPVVYFKETGKVLVLNKTNGNTVAQLYGNRVSGWLGKRITLFATEVSYQGSTMMGVRIRLRTFPSTRTAVDNPPEPPPDW